MAPSLQASFAEERLQQMLSEERLRCERHKALRDVAEAERDDAVADLASAYAGTLPCAAVAVLKF